VERVSAVIDKSLLQAICELPEQELDSCFNVLLDQFVLVVPSVLTQEIWADWANPGRRALPVTQNLIRCILHLKDSWIAEPLEIAFLELVEELPVSELPKPPSQVMNSFFTLDPEDRRLSKWMSETREKRNQIVLNRLVQQRKRLSSEQFFLLVRPGDLLTKIVWPQIIGILSFPEQKKKLLEGVLGEAFRFRHPEAQSRIDAAFAKYTSDSLNQYPITTDCIVAAMTYFYAPFFKLRSAEGQPQKILDRSKQGQRNNITDEKYVQSALLVSGLLTRDAGMRSVMNVFADARWWNGTATFIDSTQPLGEALISALGNP
jgi:hypothetical protein